jgi:hypothetical protein
VGRSPVSHSFVNQELDAIDYCVGNALDRRSGPGNPILPTAERRATLNALVTSDAERRATLAALVTSDAERRATLASGGLRSRCD